MLASVGRRAGKWAALVVAFGFSLQACQDTTLPPPTGPAAQGYALLAWNDLGMHCIDGTDYSVFSILPPYNNLHAQLVDASDGRPVRSGVSLTYQALRDPGGSINTTSSDKTNFWTYVGQLYGASPAPDVGLTGNPTPGVDPAPMTWDDALQAFVATGIPITPFDDAGVRNTYPMVRVVARDGGGNVLATADVVLPVSDEMTCAACHTSRASGNAAEEAARPPVQGWVFDADPMRDWKRNILALHDDLDLGSAAYRDALAAAGYSPAGLLASADAGDPTLCAACHGSNALPGTGMAGIAPLTEALHALHGTVLDPSTLQPLDASGARDTCYLCHPGAVTQCLRGAMGKATAADGSSLIACQDCHGDLSAVGAAGRVGWLEEPTCQACHHDGVRETRALDPSGSLRSVLDTRFATNPDTPAAGFSLFRLSTGHGGLQCEACHGATHAVYPSAEPNDNLLSTALQGHAGTVAECSTCHVSVPNTTSGGPHGLHTIGSAWVRAHGEVAHDGQAAPCAACHGADYRGTFLSSVSAPRQFSAEERTVSYAPGDPVGCYDCHNGPRGD